MRVRNLHRRWPLLLSIAASVAFTGIALSEGRGPPAPAPPPLNASTGPLLPGFQFRSIGPAVMMGRVDDIQGSEKDPMTIYVGFATCGRWESTDGWAHWHLQL